MSEGVAHVPRKYVEYEYIEQRILIMQSFAGQTLTKNQRCYFGANTRLRGKRIVAIEAVGLADAAVPWQINGVNILPTSGFIDVIFSIVDPKTNEDLIYHFPLLDIAADDGTFSSKGLGRKLRIFDLDVDHDIERSYIETTVSGARIWAILFNFYTVPW